MKAEELHKGLRVKVDVPNDGTGVHGATGTVDVRAGLIVPEGWWVDLDDGRRTMFDPHELRPLEEAL